jgi:hypothetical protein
MPPRQIDRNRGRSRSVRASTPQVEQALLITRRLTLPALRAAASALSITLNRGWESVAAR